MYKKIKSNKLYMQILEQIKKNIIQGNLKSGDRLPSERQWAEQLGVSRASIREVIRALEIIGIVICQQGEGNFIGKNFDDTLTQPLSIMFWLSNGKISEIQELRRALEIEAAKLASKHMTFERYESMKKFCISIETEKNESCRIELDKHFHDEIAIASKNKMIKNILKTSTALIENNIKNIYNTVLWDSKRATIINQQHRNILKTLQNGDPKESGNAMSQHMDLFEGFLTDIEL